MFALTNGMDRMSSSPISASLTSLKTNFFDTLPGIRAADLRGK
jgi:hypothetical protein